MGKLLQEIGIDMDTGSHWSANIADILIAERYFGDDRSAFNEFMEWRKKVERTDFFQNELVGKILNRQLQYTKYKRTTHPLKRGRYARRSWVLSGALHSLGKRMVDENFRAFGISKPDVIIRILAEHPNFDPEIMMRVIDEIIDNSTIKTVRRRQKRTVHFTDSALENQAYLLTKDICGDVGVLECDEMDARLYHLYSNAGRTLRALKDRIAYFHRKALLEDGAVSSELLTFVRSSKKLTVPLGPEREISIDLSSETSTFADTKSDVDRALTEINNQLLKIENVLLAFSKIEERIGSLNGVKILPGKLQEDKEKLMLAQETLLKRRETLESTLDLARDILSIREDSAALLANVNLDDAPQRRPILTAGRKSSDNLH